MATPAPREQCCRAAPRERLYHMARSARSGRNDARVRIGLIAEPDTFVPLVEALRSCARLELAAQAGVLHGAAVPDVPWYDDQRALIAQADLDALLLDVRPRRAIELSHLALEDGLHVWRTAPLARSFAEGVDVARRARSAGLVYRVASWWDHVAPIIAQLAPAGAAPVYYTRIEALGVGPGLEAWTSSAAESLGGALATEAYDLLESLIALRGSPDSLSAAVGRFRRVAGKALRETEDQASAILRYSGGGLADVRAAWNSAPASEGQPGEPAPFAPGRTWYAVHESAQHRLCYQRDVALLLDAAGGQLERQALPAPSLSAELSRFEAAVCNDAGAREAARRTLERHLAVSALLETAYLSARTSQPERPAKLYEVQKWPEPQP
jgi:predicted dehydrogenase